MSQVGGGRWAEQQEEEEVDHDHNSHGGQDKVQPAAMRGLSSASVILNLVSLCFVRLLFYHIVLCQRFRIDIPAPKHPSDNNPDDGDGQEGGVHAHEDLPRSVLPEEDVSGGEVHGSRNSEYHGLVRPKAEDVARDHKRHLKETGVTFLELCCSTVPK
jgi:hypothetical protein